MSIASSVFNKPVITNYPPTTFVLEISLVLSALVKLDFNSFHISMDTSIQFTVDVPISMFHIST